MNYLSGTEFGTLVHGFFDVSFVTLVVRHVVLEFVLSSGTALDFDGKIDSWRS